MSYKPISIRRRVDVPFVNLTLLLFWAHALPSIIRFFEKPKKARLIEFFRNRRGGSVVRLSLG